jgi:hypothetical protein
MRFGKVGRNKMKIFALDLWEAVLLKAGQESY